MSTQTTQENPRKENARPKNIRYPNERTRKLVEGWNWTDFRRDLADLGIKGKPKEAIIQLFQYMENGDRRKFKPGVAERWEEVGVLGKDGLVDIDPGVWDGKTSGIVLCLMSLQYQGQVERRWK